MPLEKHEAEKLIEVIRGLSEPRELTYKGKRLDAVAGNGGKATTETAVRHVADPTTPGPALRVDAELQRVFDEEALYQRFRARIIDDAQIDPVLLKLIAVQPEMIVEYERRVETLDGSSIRGRVAKLIAQGFMDEQRTTGAVRSELARTGSDVNSGGLSTSLGALLSQGFLVRAGDGWKRAPGIKITEKLLEVKA